MRGSPTVERLGYFAELAAAQLEGVTTLVLVDALPRCRSSPIRASRATSYLPGCAVYVLAAGADDAPGALEALAELVARTAKAPERGTGGRDRRSRPAPLSAKSVADAVGATLPEGAIVSDESNTAGIWMSGATAGCPPHEWMCLTGGAIGQGLPVATGAAIAAPGRRVVCLEADGSAMYTLQSWWTQARESLDVTTVILENHSYAILELELSRVGAQAAGTDRKGDARARPAAARLRVARTRAWGSLPSAQRARRSSPTCSHAASPNPGHR